MKPFRPGTGELRGPTWAQMETNADLRFIARHTGGQVSIYKYASRAFDRLERGTRSHYVLGYYPGEARWDGGERHLTVRVRRPGVTVQHRRSYYAREDLVPYDRREFLTSTRIAADIAVFLGNRAQRLVGELKKRIDLRLEPESYARIRRDGVSFSATVDATAPVRHVKAVVYDYPADRLGTAVTQLK